MVVLIATLGIQALAALMVLTPPVFASLVAPDFGISANHIGLYIGIAYAAAVCRPACQAVRCGATARFG